MSNFTLSKSLRTGLSVSLLSVVLMMGACGKKDKGGAPVISAEKAPLGLSGLSDKDFARHFAVPKRDIDAAQSTQALAALGLDESKSNGLSWDSQSGGSGNYVFKNMTSTSDDGTVTIGKAQLFGVRMDGEVATFDRADFGDLKLIGDDVKLNVASMSLARPTADTAKAMLQSLEKISEDLDLDFGDDTKFGFGALSMKDVDITADEVTGNIDQLVWGMDEDTKRADLKIENVDFNIPQKGSNIASLMTLKGLSARGVNVNQVTNNDAGVKGMADGVAGLFNNAAHEKAFDSFSLEAFEFDNDAMSIDLPKMEAESTEKGDIITTTQVLAPSTIKMKEGISGAGRQAYEVLQQLGFDAMTFKGSQTAIIDKGADTLEVKDGIFDMSDSFRLNYTYKATGLDALKDISNADGQDNQATQFLAALEHMKVNGMTISLEDKSIVERGLKLAAQMRGGEVNQIKREMRAAIAIAPFAARNDFEKEVANQLGGAFMDFVDDGGTLTVQLTPEEPINFSKLQSVENMKPEDLGFSARHDK